MIRIGLGGILYFIIIIRNPQNPVPIIRAPTLMHLKVGSRSCMSLSPRYVTLKHSEDKVIVFERGDLLFIFNFHPCNSISPAPAEANGADIELRLARFWRLGRAMLWQ